MKNLPMPNGGNSPKFLAAVALFTLILLVAGALAASAAPLRIVVLPFYSEEGVDAGGQSRERVLHYRRTMRFINNQLDRHGFEVINPFAKENIEKEYDRVMQRAREDSVLAIREVCEKYGVDVAYIVWLKLKVKHTPDGYYKAVVNLDGEGYNSAGHDLGAGLFETFKVTRRDRDQAIGEVEKWAGDLVGRKLTDWRGEYRTAATEESHETDARREGGVLARNAEKHADVVNVRLDGATEYELSEVFGKVLNTVTGVVEAKRYGGNIDPTNPQASYMAWRLEIADTEPFRLEANILKMIKDVVEAGGTLELKGVPYRYTPGEVALLKGILPGKSNAAQLQFVIDRNRAIDREMSSGRAGGFN